MNASDIGRMEKQADVSFEKGHIVGEVTKRTIKRIIIWSSIIFATISLFIFGFIRHKNKQKL